MINWLQVDCLSSILKEEIYEGERSLEVGTLGGSLNLIGLRPISSTGQVTITITCRPLLGSHIVP